MITTKTDHSVTVEMYKKLCAFGHDIECMSFADDVCTCGLTETLDRARKMIEESAKYLHLTRKRLPCGRLQKRKRPESSECASR